MRVVRVLGGIVLVTVAVLAFLSGGALWIAMQHASADGGFGGPVSGLTTTGNAVVVPDIGALLRQEAALTGHSGTAVTIDAVTTTGPAFIGLAPIKSVEAYLGTHPYGRVTSLRVGSGGLPVTMTSVAPSSPRTALVLGRPAAQRFWAISGADGRIEWSPSNKKYDQLALVIMRSDAGGPVVVTANAEVSAGWLASATWALLAVGTVLAGLAIALLMWPNRRREIVYVVTPTQLPEIAERLGVLLDPSDAAPAFVPEPRAHVVAEEPLAPWPQPASPAAAEPAVTPVTPPTPATTEPLPSWAGPTPGPAESISTVRASVSMAHAEPDATIPAVFADPSMRPNSLRTAMLLNPAEARAAGQPAPMRTNERGTYRSFGTPPPVTPAFLWTTTGAVVAEDDQAEAETAAATA